MLNYIWSGIILVSIICAAITGRMEAVATAAVEGAASAVSLGLTLLGVMMLWTGLMQVAHKSGLTKAFAALLRPLLRIIFPTLDTRSPAAEAIAMNMTANILGMGNAATPLGVSAMKALSDQNGNRDVASDNMCALVVINTASLQLLPITVIAMRKAAQSASPFWIVLPGLCASMIAVAAGVIATRLFALRKA